MTTIQALQAINVFPIPTVTLEVICLDRELIGSTVYTKLIGDSQNYQLATADVYLYLAGQPSLTEQEAGINNAISVKGRFLGLANKIYGTYGDPKYSGGKYGFNGEDWT